MGARRLNRLWLLRHLLPVTACCGVFLQWLLDNREARSLRWACRLPSHVAFAAPGTPSPENLMKALGCELWVIGDELLTVSARATNGRDLGIAGISIRNAGDWLLENSWEDVMGELESAAASSDVLPYYCFEGLVNLFAYEEPVPSIEWLPARNSLLTLSEELKKKGPNVLRGLEGSYRSETAASIIFVIERLSKASKLFIRGGFYMPADPRSEKFREGRGKPRDPEPRPFEWARGPPPTEAEERMLERLERLRLEAEQSAQAVGGRAPALLQEVEGELQQARASASPEEARRAALRMMVRNLHPDRNPDNPAEVTPIFQYVQQLRTEEK